MNYSRLLSMSNPLNQQSNQSWTSNPSGPVGPLGPLGPSGNFNSLGSLQSQQSFQQNLQSQQSQQSFQSSPQGFQQGTKSTIDAQGPTIYDPNSFTPSAYQQWNQEQQHLDKVQAIRKLGNYQVRPTPPCQQLSSVIEQAYQTTMNNMPFTALDQPCCPTPSNCAEDVQWKAQFKHCPTTSVNTPAMTCAVAPKGDRYFVADLNPLLFERSLMDGAMWNPYKHFDNRQMLAQFLWSDIRPSGKDPYSKRISNLDDNFCIKQAKQGPPQYVSF